MTSKYEDYGMWELEQMGYDDIDDSEIVIDSHGNMEIYEKYDFLYLNVDGYDYCVYKAGDNYELCAYDDRGEDAGTFVINGGSLEWIMEQLESIFNLNEDDGEYYKLLRRWANEVF